MQGQPLIEMMLVECEILERASDFGGRMRVACTVAAADEINDNGRVYPEKIQDREIARINKIIEEGWAYGGADHPKDGLSSIKDVAARFVTPITKHTTNGRKTYRTEAIILNTEPGGKNLQEMIETKGKVHLSQRGWGDLVEGDWNGKKAQIVQDNYRLKTFDFVIGGSTKGAEIHTEMTEQMGIINLVECSPCEGCQREGIETNSSKGGSQQMEIKMVEDLRKAYPDLCVAIVVEAVTAREKELREAWEKEYKASLKEVADGIKKDIEESEQYKAYLKGMNAHKAIVLEIAALVAPYVSEIGDKDTDDDAIEELRKELKQTKMELEQTKAELDALKKKTQKATDDAAAKKAAEQKIGEMTAGKEHGKLIAERLADCATVEEVVARFPKEDEFVKKIIAEQTKGKPAGNGVVIDENLKDKGPALTEDQKRAQELAGIV